MRLGQIILLSFSFAVIAAPAISQRSDTNVLELSDSAVNELTIDSLLFLDSIAKSADPFFDRSDSINTEKLPPPTDSISKEFKFSIYKQEIDDQTSVFNSLVFVNNSQELTSGELSLQLPNGWSHLASQQLEFTANPGEITYIPMRLIAPKNLEGGQSYIIGATVILEDGKKLKTYAYVQKTAHFNLIAINQTSSIRINPITLAGETGIRIINDGNVNEPIQISFDHSLDYDLITPNSLVLTSFNLKAKSDTLISLAIRRTLIKDSLDGNNALQDELRYKISSSNAQIEGVFFIENFQSSLLDDTYKRLSPLIISGGVYNIGSPGGERYMTAAGGKLQLSAKKDLDYFLGSNNLGQVGSTALGDGAIRGVYQYRLGFRAGFNRFELNSRLNNKHIPICYQGIRYQYHRERIIFSSELGKSYRPDTYVSSSSLAVSRFGIPFNLGYSQTFGNRNYRLSAFEAGIKTPIFRFLRLGGGATYYMGEITAPTALAPRSINQFGYYAAGDLNAGKVSVSGRWNFRPVNGFTISGDRASLVLSGKIKTDNAFGHRFDLTNMSQNFTREDFSNNIENRFASWTTTYNTAGNLMVSLIPQYRSLVRENVASSSTARLSTFYYGSSFGLSKRLSHLDVISVFANPMITHAVYDFEPTLIRGYTVRSDLNPAYNLGLRYTRNNTLNITGDVFRGPFFIYNYSVISADTAIIPFSSGLIRVSAGYNNEFKISNIDLILNLRAFYSLDVVTLSEQFNVGANAVAMLPKGISITSYVNWFASSYESPTGEISNKNININAAISKSFYWQQPYEKFYKLIILCFEDLNGNGSRENNEPFLPNVNISLRAEKQDLINKKHSRSPNTDLITDISGRVRLTKIPAATYDIKFYELFNVSDLHPTFGFEQEILLNEDKIIEVPFIKNYHVRGSVSIIKAKRSRLASFNLESLIITAKSENGEVYKTLTDEFGNYNLSIPGTGIYKLTCKHGYQEMLESKNAEALVDFNGMKEYSYDFIFYEKDRLIDFSGGELGEQEPAEEQIMDEIKEPLSQPNEMPDFFKSLADEMSGDKLEPYNYPGKTISRQEAIEQIGNDFERQIEYRLVIGSYKESLKNEDLEQLIDVAKNNKLNIEVINDYLIVNRDFIDKKSADRFSDSLRNVGIDTATMLGKYQEVLIELED